MDTPPPAPTGLKKPVALPVALRVLAATLVYFGLGWLAQQYFSFDGSVGFFWPASGWALATMLLGGRRYVWVGGLGSFFTDWHAGSPVLAALGSGIAEGAGMLLAHWLLTRKRTFDVQLGEVADYRDLVLLGSLPAAALSGLLGVSSLVLGETLQASDFLSSLTFWFLGVALGIQIVTPLVLNWRQIPTELLTTGLRMQFAGVMLLMWLLGQMVYLDWFPDILPEFSRKALWVIPPCLWAAVRLGPQITSLLIGLLTTQINLSVHDNVGFLRHELPLVRAIDGWFSIAIFGTTLLVLASHIRKLRKSEAELRIAATAFECQEGMIVTDAQMRILRTNESFTRIMGYRNDEVVGQTTTFMRSDRHPASFYENAWRTGREHGVWSDEVWHRRKNGEVFPQWLTCTAVKNEDGVITNYVVTHTDISYRKQQEAELQASQLAQRDALVREVHHRIKNNLQGISGLLRQFAQAYPETAEPINQAIGQVRSIAVIHGLQGLHSEHTIRLCELTRAIASDISVLWQVPVNVAIPSPWIPCIVAEAEAVPLALVIKELITNAVKHGDHQTTRVEIELCKGVQADHIQIRISNSGIWREPAGKRAGGPMRSGLQLIEAMLPPSGAQLVHDEVDGMIHVKIMLSPPVITLETARKPHVPDPDTQSPALAG